MKKTAVATAVAAAAVSGLTVLPAHADTRTAHRVAAQRMAITLDHVTLDVSSRDIPAGKPYVAAPGAGVQVASVGDLKPAYQYLSVMAVPFGETLPQSVYPFPVSEAGDTAAWARALHGTQNGPVATVFGQRVRGIVVHSHGDLTGRKGRAPTSRPSSGSSTPAAAPGSSTSSTTRPTCPRASAPDSPSPAATPTSAPPSTRTGPPP
ncbi:hypothetical protein ACFQZC_37750 [Streptacidiphilus monticola]